MYPLPNATPKPQSRHIQVFSDGCQLCKNHIDNVEVGKCRGCKLEIFSINDKSDRVIKKLDRYQVTIHPTTVIDDEIKVEGKPDFYWQCGGDFYNMLKNKYPLTQ